VQDGRGWVLAFSDFQRVINVLVLLVLVCIVEGEARGSFEGEF
jgi:hypothetical protein